MAIIGYNESSLLNSEIFQGINSDDTTNAQQKAISLIKSAKHLTNNDIEGAYIQVKQLTDGLTKEALKAFDSGRVELIYNDDPSLSVTQALPFITFKTGKGYITYAFVDKYVKNHDGVYKMESTVLRDVLIGATIANGLKNNYSNLASNQYLQTTLMNIYVQLVCRIINRDFSIAANKTVYETIQYWIGKFFLHHIFCTNDTPENIDKIASKHFKMLDELEYENIKTQYANADPTKFSELLELVKTASPRMKTLHISTFLSSWLNYYYVSSMLAVDNVEYLIYMTIALLNGNNSIVSIAASDIVKETKNIKSLRGELLKLI